MSRIGSKSRFSFLEKAAKQAGLQAAPNSPVGRYLAYKKTETEVKRRKTLTPAQIASQRKSQLLALAPFGVTVGAAFVASDFYTSSVSEWSATYVANVAGINEGTDLGWREPSADTLDGSLFYPAQLVIQKPSGGTADPNTVSQITGRKYKYVPTNSYTIPFGRTATITAGEIARRNVLFGIFKGLAGDAKVSSVSYKPEYFDVVPTASTNVAGLTPAPVEAP